MKLRHLIIALLVLALLAVPVLADADTCTYQVIDSQQYPYPESPHEYLND